MKKKIWSSVAVVAILIAAVVYYNPVVHYHNQQVGDALQKWAYSNQDLQESIPFEWDCASKFGAYSSKEDMMKTMGVSGRFVTEEVQDGRSQIYFVKDGKVVAYIKGELDSQVVSKMPEVYDTFDKA